MSDPQPATLKPKPRRAEPLQPDLPGRGDETGSSQSVDIDHPTDAADRDADRTEKNQGENARRNVNKGYE